MACLQKISFSLDPSLIAHAFMTRQHGEDSFTDCSLSDNPGRLKNLLLSSFFGKLFRNLRVCVCERELRDPLHVCVKMSKNTSKERFCARFVGAKKRECEGVEKKLNSGE